MMWVVGWKKRMANVNFKDTALAMYLSDDSHQAMDLLDHTLIGVYPVIHPRPRIVGIMAATLPMPVLSNIVQSNLDPIMEFAMNRSPTCISPLA